MWFVLLMSCAEAPAKHKHHHVSVLEEPSESIEPRKAVIKSEKKAPTTKERMVEMKSDMGEAKDDLSCIKTFLQCREEGSMISFEDYEAQNCK